MFQQSENHGIFPNKIFKSMGRYFIFLLKKRQDSLGIFKSLEKKKKKLSTVNYDYLFFIYVQKFSGFLTAQANISKYC